MRIYEEAEIDDALDGRIRDCLIDCFPPDREVFSRSRAWHGSAPVFSVVEESGGLVIGQVGIVRRRVRVGGEELEVAGVQNVAVRSQARGSGLGPALLGAAMRGAAERGVPFGLLFCVPELGPYYARQGWLLDPVPATMEWEGRSGVPIPAKNICMTLALGESAFPEGAIEILGADW